MDALDRPAALPTTPTDPSRCKTCHQPLPTVRETLREVQALANAIGVTQYGIDNEKNWQAIRQRVNELLSPLLRDTAPKPGELRITEEGGLKMAERMLRDMQAETGDSP